MACEGGAESTGSAGTGVQRSPCCICTQCTSLKLPLHLTNHINTNREDQNERSQAWRRLLCHQTGWVESRGWIAWEQGESQQLVGPANNNDILNASITNEGNTDLTATTNYAIIVQHSPARSQRIWPRGFALEAVSIYEQLKFQSFGSVNKLGKRAGAAALGAGV